MLRVVFDTNLLVSYMLVHRPPIAALIDEYLLILTASCQVQGVDLGTVVTERLHAGGLLERERRALHAAHDRTDSDAGDPALDAGGVDECVAVLLTWLQSTGQGGTALIKPCLLVCCEPAP